MVAPLVSIAAGSVTAPSVQRPAAANSAAAQPVSQAFAALLGDEFASAPVTGAGGEALPPAGEALPVTAGADPVSRDGGREITDASPGSPREPDVDGADMAGLTGASAAPTATPVAVSEQLFVNAAGNSHREAVTTSAAGPDDSPVSAPLASQPSPVQRASAAHPDDTGVRSSRYSDAGIDSVGLDHADPQMPPAGATPLTSVRPVPGEASLTNAAGPQASLRLSAQPAVDARPQVAQLRPGQVGEASEEADIESLMRSVRQAERKPLPGGILRALEAQQQRLAPERPGTGAIDKTVVTPMAAGGMAGRITPPADQALPVAGSAEAVRGVVAVTPTPLAAVPTGHDNSGAAADIALAVTDLSSTDGDEAGDVLNRPAAVQTASTQPRGIPAAGLGLPQGLVPGTPSWGHAVGERLVLMSAGGVQVAEIQLDPPELGSLHVRLQVQHDQVSLNISSPHAQVREALEQQMPRLREMLAEQGLDLGSSTVADDSDRRGRQADDSSGAAFASGADAGESVETVAEGVTARRLSLVDHYV